jgi:beta-1,4-mannosyltransferase
MSMIGKLKKKRLVNVPGARKQKLVPLRVASWPGSGAKANPFVSNFLSGLEKAGCEVISFDTVSDFKGQAYDILLLQWAERVFWESTSRWKQIWTILRLLRFLQTRAPHIRVVWLVHNLRPHDVGRWGRLIWTPYMWALTRLVAGFLTLSPGTLPEVRATLPAFAQKPADYIWHPLYPGAELSEHERLVARSRYGWDDTVRVLGYCGQIRPYKGLDELADAFLRTKRPDLRLLIAGRPSNTATVAKLEVAAKKDTRIALDLKDLSGAEFRLALGACDVMAAPFHRYLHSGSIVHALSAVRPVLTPATPFSKSLCVHLGREWVRTYEGSLTPELLETEENIRPPITDLNLIDFNPDAVGQQTVRFFREILGHTDFDPVTIVPSSQQP